VEIIIEIVRSPLGPPLVLLAGAIAELILGRWLRRPGWLTGLALFFVGAASLLWLGLRMQPVIPIYSRPWQPLLQNGANLLWVGDGWNWYISGLVLLIGGLGALLELNNFHPADVRSRFRTHTSLAIHLSVLAGALLFVGSGNLLTAILTWVVMDLFMLLRSAARPQPADRNASPQDLRQRLQRSQAKGLSLLGAFVLLIGLLPAGPNGPGQPLQGGAVPLETVALMLLASAIRAGIYPFHLWLVPSDRKRVDLAERFLDQIIPTLSGLWLMGWALDMGAQFLLLRPEVVLMLVLSLLSAAIVAWTASDQPTYSVYVLITSAGVAGLAGALGFNPGPSALIWPTTVFALGGGLWLVGSQVWRSMGWQIPVSVGALGLAGLPFTPGFLVQPALARLLMAGGVFALIFLLYALGQSLLIATMLRSWEGRWQGPINGRTPGAIGRMIAASAALGAPLAIAGFFPGRLAALASLPDAMPPLLGNPPNVVAEAPVWITLAVPLVMGIALVWVRPHLWPRLGDLPETVSRFMRLDWLFDLVWWIIASLSQLWGNGVRVLEGAGYMGWVLVILLLVYLLR
jgi:hypothetical protein